MTLDERAIVPSRAADLRAMYSNTAANVDRAVGEVIAAVRRAAGTTPAVIVTADHGESLFDDGLLGHGIALTDVQTRIPLIVTGLPMTVEQPIGQSEFRDAINLALRVGNGSEGRPVLRTVPGKEIFQYMGGFGRPAQIAHTRADGRTLFDFRTGLVQTWPSRGWRRPEDLTVAERGAFVDLVHVWERMRHSSAVAR
jgi:hypothetical protein